METAPAAEAAAAIYRAHGAKGIYSRQFSPAAMALYRMEAGDKMSPRTARIALRLARQEAIPGWVASQLDLALLEVASGG
jgi:hypothetical protein